MKTHSGRPGCRIRPRARRAAPGSAAALPRHKSCCSRSERSRAVLPANPPPSSQEQYWTIHSWHLQHAAVRLRARLAQAQGRASGQRHGRRLCGCAAPPPLVNFPLCFTKIPVNTQTAAAGAGQPAPKTRTAVFVSCGAKFSCAVPRSELCGAGPGSFCLL